MHFVIFQVTGCWTFHVKSVVTGAQENIMAYIVVMVREHTYIIDGTSGVKFENLIIFHTHLPLS